MNFKLFSQASAGFVVWSWSIYELGTEHRQLQAGRLAVSVVCGPVFKRHQLAFAIWLGLLSGYWLMNVSGDCLFSLERLLHGKLRNLNFSTQHLVAHLRGACVSGETFLFIFYNAPHFSHCAYLSVWPCLWRCDVMVLVSHSLLSVTSWAFSLLMDPAFKVSEQEVMTSKMFYYHYYYQLYVCISFVILQVCLDACWGPYCHKAWSCMDIVPFNIWVYWYGTFEIA